MQKIFSQELRFKDENGEDYPDWENSKIEKYLKERNERSDKGQMLSVTINSGIIKFSELDRKDNSSKDKSNYKVVRKNDIAYNSMRMWQGLVVNQIIMGLLALHILCFIQHKILAHYLLDISLKHIE